MRQFYTILTFAVFSIFVAACTKTSETSSFPLGITAKINGTPWTATSYSATLDSSSFLMIIGYVGSASSGTNISFSINNYTKTTGTYSITVMENGAEYDDHSINAYHVANSGSITLTQASATNVQGTFNFSDGAYSITDGQFNLPIK